MKATQVKKFEMRYPRQRNQFHKERSVPTTYVCTLANLYILVFQRN